MYIYICVCVASRSIRQGMPIVHLPTLVSPACCHQNHGMQTGGKHSQSTDT